jgi:hypothetical protein
MVQGYDAVGIWSPAIHLPRINGMSLFPGDYLLPASRHASRERPDDRMVVIVINPGTARAGAAGFPGGQGYNFVSDRFGPYHVL